MRCGAAAYGWALRFLLAFVLVAGCASSSGPPVGPTTQPEQVRSSSLPALREVRWVRSPLAHTQTPAVTAAREGLERRLEALARDAGQPWVLDHALLALGPGLTLADGRLATDALAGWAVAEAGGPSFPRVVGEVRVSPHADLVLKTLVEVGAPAGFARGALAASLARPWSAPGRPGETWDDTAWTAFAWALTVAPDAVWATSDGRTVSLAALRAGLVAELAVADGALAAARASQGELVKDKSGIFAYTCGGAHLVQAATALVAAGGTEGERAAVAEAGATLRWRLPRELALTDRVAAAHPEAADALAVQRMKLLGHGLESLHRLAVAGLVSGAADEVGALEAELAKTAAALEEAGVWARVSAGAAREQSELDLLGDASHAVHALRVGAGITQIPW